MTYSFTLDLYKIQYKVPLDFKYFDDSSIKTFEISSKLTSTMRVLNLSIFLAILPSSLPNDECGELV